ncbi:MAG: GNAT family N-acetyltransferase [Eubacteriales bacterium]|nr:GNAT family N-acetyltransferase [Eubacteriales bacterium]
MVIRRARESDCPEILRLLSQVLEIHAALRPDLFITGTTKYTEADLKEMFKDDKRPVYVACAEDGRFLGYAFCEILEPVPSNNQVPVRSLYLDDLGVNEESRHLHVGRALFDHVRQEAERLGCHDLQLHVWEGNDARAFYEKMGMTVRKTLMELVL